MTHLDHWNIEPAFWRRLASVIARPFGAHVETGRTVFVQPSFSRLPMTETEFNAGCRRGYNRIPVSLETFCRPRHPLSIY